MTSTIRRRRLFGAALAATTLVTGLLTATPAQAADVAVPVTEGALTLRGNELVVDDSFSTRSGDAFTLESGARSDELSPHVRVHLAAADGQWFDLAFYGGSAPLAVGTYDDAVQWSYSAPERPALSLSGNGSGCSGSLGDFRVNQIRYGAGGAIEALDVNFAYYCEGRLRLSMGHLVVNYPSEPEPPQGRVLSALTFAGRDTGEYHSGLGDMIVGVTRHDGNAVVVAAARAGSYDRGSFAIAAPAGEPLRVGTYPDARSYWDGSNAGPRLTLDGPRGSCPGEHGTFTIRQLRFAPDGSVALLDLAFTRVCEYPGGNDPTTGEVILNIPGPPPFTLALTADRADLIRDKSWYRTGIQEVRVGGTVTCSGEAWMIVTGTLTQEPEGQPLVGHFGVPVSCAAGEVTPWSETVVWYEATDRDFAPGAATLTAHTTIVDPVYLNTVTAETTSTVRLRLPETPAIPRRTR
ncbi:hypothetical protein AB0J86_38125 [Micromonospora sp. NPDC049559]|uniref:hypothetical protein n=1 Tax=Micromonospora sp. NPDC049559 TaxID=3155923 RepID=UPI00342A823C